MIEYGQTSGWLINKYINTGDTSLYRVLKNYAFKEYSDAYKGLMEYNMALPEKDRLTLVGVDLERGVNSAVKVLSLLIPRDKVPHDSIDIHIESILGLAMFQDREYYNDDEEEEEDFSYGRYSVTQTLNLVIENFRNHPELYQEFLDSNFDIFSHTITNLEDVRRWHEMEENSTIQDYVYREKYMYKRFKEEYLARGGTFYGQFGRCHSTKKLADKNSCGWYSFRSFAHRLKNDPDMGLKDQILSIGVFYEDDDFSNYDWKPIQSKVEKLFSKLDDDRVLLYDFASDTALHNFFKEDFDFVFLNTTSPSEDHPYFDIDDYNFDQSATYDFCYMYTRSQFDLDQLNQIFTGVTLEQFSNTLVSHGIEFSSNEEDGFVSRTTLGWFTGQSITTVENSTYSNTVRLKGWSYNNLSMYNFLRNMKAVDLLLGVSLGYTQLMMDIQQDYEINSTSVNNANIGNQRVVRYTNPGITAGAVAGVNLTAGKLTLGGSYGIQKDLSKTKWMSVDRLRTGPKTSLTSPYLALRLGVRIDN